MDYILLTLAGMAVGFFLAVRLKRKRATPGAKNF